MTRLIMFHERFAYFRRWLFIYLAVTISVPTVVISVVAFVNYAPGLKIDFLKIIFIVGMASLIRYIFTSNLFGRLSDVFREIKLTIPRVFEIIGASLYVLLTMASIFDLVDINVDPIVFHSAGVLVCFLLARDIILDRTKVKYKSGLDH